MLYNKSAGTDLIWKKIPSTAPLFNKGNQILYLTHRYEEKYMKVRRYIKY